MKEVISERNKKPYMIAQVISVVSLAVSLIYTRVPIVHKIGIAFICAFSFATVVFTVILVDNRPVIEKDGDKLTVIRGLYKTVVSLSDVKEVSLTPHPSKKGEFQSGSVTITAVIKGKEKKLICGDVIDAERVVEKINALL